MLEIRKLEHDMALQAKQFRWDVFKALIAAVGVAATLLVAGGTFVKLFLS